MERPTQVSHERQSVDIQGSPKRPGGPIAIFVMTKTMMDGINALASDSSADRLDEPLQLVSHGRREAVAFYSVMHAFVVNT
jgi:hypothetical protein